MNTTLAIACIFLMASFSACGKALNSDSLLAPTHFSNGQAAGSVIGQIDFVSSAHATTATRLNQPVDLDLAADGSLRVADLGNSRVLIFNSIPSIGTTGTAANEVLGQTSFTTNNSNQTSANSFTFLMGIRGSAGKFAVVDDTRVLLYNAYPKIGNPAADVAIGAANTSTPGIPGCAASTFVSPSAVAMAGTKLLIVDGTGKRVLVYRSLPTTSNASADFALGEPNLNTCTGGVTGSLMTFPQAAWSDGVRVVVADGNRVLIWNAFPTTSGQAADLVLGQANFTTNTVNAGGVSAQSLNAPIGIASDGNRLVIADSLNHRILIWNRFPTLNHQAADTVLGQTDFSSRVAATTATGLNEPAGLAMDANHILAGDVNNNRIQIWYGQ